MNDKLSSSAQAPVPLRLLLDTNVVLDLWLFQDPRLQPLRESLQAGRTVWLATEAMQTELSHVREREFTRRWVPAVEWLEPPCQLVPPPDNPAPWRCRDRSDQKFLDLAWQLKLPLWTRDRDLLQMRKRAARDGVAIETPEAGLHRLS